MQDSRPSISVLKHCIICIFLIHSGYVQKPLTDNFIFLSLKPNFHKIDQKTFKVIISGLHFTTSVNILPKLRYSEGRNFTKNCLKA